MPAPTIAIHVSPARVEGAVIPSAGAIEALQSVSLPVNEGVETVLNTIVMLVRRLLETQDNTIDGIGVAIDGLLAGGELIHADNDLQLLRGIALQSTLEAEFGRRTCLENTVNTIALAEAHLGAGNDSESSLYVFADDIIGGAFVYQGQIWHGAHAGAGQIGYLLSGWMSHKPVTLNDRASGRGIAMQYDMRSRKFRTPTLAEIIQYASQGDQLASRVIRDAARVLGKVLSPVVGLIDPQCLIVGGSLAEIGDLWWIPFENALRDNPLPALTELDIRPAQVAEQPILRGTGLLFHVDSLPRQ